MLNREDLLCVGLLHCFPPTLMAVMNDKWRQISENRKRNPSKITGGKVRKETVNKGTPAFMGQPHRAASGLSRRRSCYSVSLPGGGGVSS